MSNQISPQHLKTENYRLRIGLRRNFKSLNKFFLICFVFCSKCISDIFLLNESHVSGFIHDDISPDGLTKRGCMRELAKVARAFHGWIVLLFAFMK